MRHCFVSAVLFQGALGSIFYYGIGRKQNLGSAYECITQSAERGNVYSMGLLCDYYYHTKLYVKAAELALK
jgi:TPR repeat protein